MAILNRSWPNNVFVDRCIEQQAMLIKQKQSRSTGKRFIEASLDEADLMSHYRKIEYLFRQLQVSTPHVEEIKNSDSPPDRCESKHMEHR